MISRWVLLVFDSLLIASLAIHLTTAQEAALVAPETTPSAALEEPGNVSPGAPEKKEEHSRNDTAFNADYCDASLCSEGKKHVACNGITRLHKKCSLDAEVLDINDKLQRYLVGHFNELRDSVAKGGFNGLSPAARMGTLKWDSELSYLAEFNVQDCFLKNDECRNTKTSTRVGQTVGYRAMRGKIPELEDILKAIIGLWMRENSGTSMLDIMKYKDPQKGPPKYNFIQIILENAGLVGCAILQQTRNDWLQTFFTCNFGHAPVLGAEVYESSQLAAQSCKTGVNQKYVHLCSDSEIYEKKEPSVGNSVNASKNARTVRKEDFVALKSATDGAAPVGIQPRDGGAAPAAEGAAVPAPEGGAAPAAQGAAAPAAEGAATPAAEGAAAPAAEGAAAPVVEGAAAPAAEGAANPAAEGATPVAGDTPIPAAPPEGEAVPAGAEAPNSASPGGPGPPTAAPGEETTFEGLLEPTPTPPDKAALQKKFARFLDLMNRAEMHHGRRKIVVITSNHMVDDDRVKQKEAEESASNLNTLKEAVFRTIRSRRQRMTRSGLMARSMSHGFRFKARSHHRRGHQRSSDFAPQWIVIS
uniref:Uncharacterized protein LOC108048367 n=1 Tax=Drosophila rhopaloa TaxID=1041015 RepID=A0A6P4FAV5_DRORH